MGIKFWVNDKDRMCLITMGKESHDEAEADGYREVTAEEQDAFREETRKIKPGKRGLSRSGKSSDIANALGGDE